MIDDKPTTTQTGLWQISTSNTLIALRRHKDLSRLLYWDEFGQRTMVESGKELGLHGEFPRRITDTDIPFITANVAASQPWCRCGPGDTMVGTCVEAIAREQARHPVRAYLRGLRWDATQRACFWLSRYLGTPDTGYTRAAAQSWLVAAVARVMIPGCQVDSALVLEGPQGIGKSSALAALAGGPEWYLDGLPGDMGGRDAAAALQGKWLVELTELSAVNRAETEAVRAFLSRRVDSYRAAYARHVVDAPRQCVFAGTTNASRYLRDETGSRRFWIIPCRPTWGSCAELVNNIRIERNQIWAEAVALYDSGERWYLDSDASADAAEIARTRATEDPWEETIEPWLLARDECTVAEALGQLGLETAKRTARDGARVERMLTKLGWLCFGRAWRRGVGAKAKVDKDVDVQF